LSVHAFVDESERNGSYLLSAAIVEPRRLMPTRKFLAGLLLPGQRELHFAKEKPGRRRTIVDQIAQLPLSVSIYTSPSCPRTAESARQRCLSRLLHDLCERRALRMVLDSRDERDTYDRQTILKTLAGHPWRDELTYEHLTSHCDPLMWIADVVGWCHGAGGDWKRRVLPLVSTVIEV
jgi:hypothetical protein